MQGDTEPTSGKNETNTGKLRNSKMPVCLQVTFGDHLWSLIILSAIVDVSHYQKLQKWLLSPTESKQRFSIKIKCHQVWVYLQLQHIVGHLGYQPLSEITEVAASAHRVNIEICNKNWTPISFGQSSTGYQPSLVAAIIQCNRNGCHPLPFVIFGCGWHPRWLTTFIIADRRWS